MRVRRSPAMPEIEFPSMPEIEVPEIGVPEIGALGDCARWGFPFPTG